VLQAAEDDVDDLPRVENQNNKNLPEERDGKEEKEQYVFPNTCEEGDRCEHCRCLQYLLSSLVVPSLSFLIVVVCQKEQIEQGANHDEPLQTEIQQA
jgi:hypothetical protein